MAHRRNLFPPASHQLHHLVILVSPDGSEFTFQERSQNPLCHETMAGQSKGPRRYNWMEPMVIPSISAGYRSGDSSVSHQRKGRKLRIGELSGKNKMELSNYCTQKNSEVSSSLHCLWLASTPGEMLVCRVIVVWGVGR